MTVSDDSDVFPEPDFAPTGSFKAEMVPLSPVAPAPDAVPDFEARRTEWMGVLHTVPVTFPGGGLPMVNLNHVLDVLAALRASAGPGTSDYAIKNIRALELANAAATFLGLRPQDEIPFEELTRRLRAASPPSGTPVAWRLEIESPTKPHHLTDEPEVAEMWRTTRFPVTPLFTHPPRAAGETLREIREHDYPILLDFFQKHGVPPKAAPSCLACGQSVPEGFSTSHIELPHVGICAKCVEAVRRAAGEPELVADDIRLARDHATFNGVHHDCALRDSLMASKLNDLLPRISRRAADAGAQDRERAVYRELLGRLLATETYDLTQRGDYQTYGAMEPSGVQWHSANIFGDWMRTEDVHAIFAARSSGTPE